MTFHDFLTCELIIIAILGIIITAVITEITKKSLTILYYKLKKLKRRNPNDYKITLIGKNTKPSLESSMRSVKKLSRMLNPPALIYNEKLFCGCLAKDKLIVKLCQQDKTRYIGMNYTPPAGYYISDDDILDY